MARATPVSGVRPKAALARNARRIILFRLADVIEWTPKSRDADDRAGLHSLRIAVKRLRYALEFFRPGFEDRLEPYLAAAVSAQESLGNVTDCDAFLLRLGSYGDRVPKSAKAGLDRLVASVEEMRSERYATATAVLASIEDSGTWAGLIREIHKPHATTKKRAKPSASAGKRPRPSASTKERAKRASRELCNCNRRKCRGPSCRRYHQGGHHS